MDAESIYREYNGKVLGYLRNKVTSQAVAEDLCSEVFVKVVSNFESFDERKSSVSTWIYTITRNTLYDYFRTNHETCELDESICADDDFVARLCTEELIERLADALQMLEPREREIIIRRYYYNESQKQINRRLGVSTTYGYMLHKAAVEKIKKILKIE